MTIQADISPSEAVSSLLSLSIAAASAAPIPISNSSQPVGNESSSGVYISALNGTYSPTGSQLGTSFGTGAKQHRRLSSIGKTRRRLSDARDAASRPSPGAASLSLTSLSLSSSPPGLITQVPTSFTGASSVLNGPVSLPGSNGMSIPLPNDVLNISPQVSAPQDESKSAISTPIPIGNGKNGRKRGMDHKCESCSKIYRHPSCLIKHRWEHTPHWREASKFVLSKHQQVQLLEAAAILSHLSDSSSSLPEDRSLWPSFLSGGSLPKAGEETIPAQNGITDTLISSYPSHPVSSSVPAGNFQRSASSGPRLHDYSIPLSKSGSGGITHLRPGLIGVPTGPITTANTLGTLSIPVPVPNSNGPSDAFRGYRNGPSTSWASSSFSQTPSSYVSNGLSPGFLGFVRSDVRGSSPDSRSRSRSASGSRSDESIEADIDSDMMEGYTARYGYRRRHAWKREDDDEMIAGFSVREEDEDEEGRIRGGDGVGKEKEQEWDGLEMEMDMDMD